MPGLTFTDHEGFQRTVLLSATGAAIAGFLAYALSSIGLAFPITVIGGAAVAAAACGKVPKARGFYGLLGGLAGSLSLLWPQHPLFGLAVAGGGLGLLFAQHRETETRNSPTLGNRMGKASFAASAAMTGLLLIAGLFVVRTFDAHQLFDLVLPGPAASIARLALLGFFVGLGAAGAHLAADQDAVEVSYAQLEAVLQGDLKQLCARAMTNYRRCAEVLGSSEAGFARSQLAKSLSDVTLRVLELARRWQNIDREVGERAEGEISQRLKELQILKENTRDEVAKRQLGAAEAALKAEVDQIDRIRRGRERVVARLHGEMALLERTRLALLGLKSSDAHLRAAELSALSENLSAVAREMDCEAEAVDQIISRVVDVVGPSGAGEAQVQPVAMGEKPRA